jgi:peptide/nickel transport system substrate-binding protein
MVLRFHRFFVSAGLLVIIAACAPAARNTPASNPAQGGAAQPAATQPSKTLVLMTRSEPDSLAGTTMVPGGGSTGGRRRLFNAGLTLLDGDARPLPYLAEALPQLNSDTWRVLPDGRMETIYRLRPNLAWHDGQPLTADDFVFAWQVYATPAFGRSGAEGISVMEEVVAPDPRTVLIKWRGAYAEAGVLEGVVSTGTPSSGPSFSPLPRHILGKTYQEDRENFVTSPFWTVEFVGAGPYKLDRWENGAFLEAAAFDQHALGRPKVDRVRLLWNQDGSAVLANLLSGEVHLPVDDSVKISEGLVLQREWGGRNAGTVQFMPKNWRHLDFQVRTEYANPRAILDERVRKALAHAIDKQAINESLFEGVGMAADSMMYPTVPYHADIDRTVAKYPFDVRRSDVLLQDAGFRKGGDGFYESAGEGRLVFQVKGTASPENAAERAVLASGWRQIGLDTEEGTFTAAEARDGSVLATFRSMYPTGAPAGLAAIGLFTSANAPRPENRWVGSNRGGWSNAEYDRLADAVQSTIEPTERARVIVQAIRTLTEQVGTVSLYFNPTVLAFPAAVQGMSVRSAEADPTWNMHEWTMQ